MFDGFMRQPCQTVMLHLAPACQHVPVLDVGIAKMKTRRLNNFQRGYRGISHAALLAKQGGRCPDHRRQRPEPPHQRLRQRLGVAAPVAGIEQHLQKFQFAQGVMPFDQQLVAHTGAMARHMVRRRVWLW